MKCSVFLVLAACLLSTVSLALPHAAPAAPAHAKVVIATEAVLPYLESYEKGTHTNFITFADKAKCEEQFVIQLARYVGRGVFNDIKAADYDMAAYLSCPALHADYLLGVAKAVDIALADKSERCQKIREKLRKRLERHCKAIKIPEYVKPAPKEAQIGPKGYAAPGAKPTYSLKGSSAPAAGGGGGGGGKDHKDSDKGKDDKGGDKGKDNKGGDKGGKDNKGGKDYAAPKKY